MSPSPARRTPAPRPRASSVMLAIALCVGCGNPAPPRPAPATDAPTTDDPLAEALRATPDTRDAWPQLQQHSQALVAKGGAATPAIAALLVEPSTWRKAALGEALIDRTEPGLEGPTLAVLGQLGAPYTWAGDPAPLTRALDRCVAALSPEVAGPTLAQVMTRTTPLAERAAHHFDAHPPAAADALLETLLQSTEDVSARQRLARSLLRLPSKKTVNARAHNAMRRADLKLGLALLSAEAAVSDTPRFDDVVVAELVVRLLGVPQEVLGTQEKFPVALMRYPKARGLLLSHLATAPAAEQVVLARLLMQHTPSTAEREAVGALTEAGVVTDPTTPPTPAPEPTAEGASPTSTDPRRLRVPQSPTPGSGHPG